MYKQALVHETAVAATCNTVVDAGGSVISILASSTKNGFVVIVWRTSHK